MDDEFDELKTQLIRSIEELNSDQQKLLILLSKVLVCCNNQEEITENLASFVDTWVKPKRISEIVKNENNKRERNDEEDVCMNEIEGEKCETQNVKNQRYELDIRTTKDPYKEKQEFEKRRKMMLEGCGQHSHLDSHSQSDSLFSLD